MFRKTLIALSATAALAGAGTQAQAHHTTVGFSFGTGDFNVSIGSGGGYYEPSGYYDVEECGWHYVKKVKWVGGVKKVKIIKKWICE
jgi:hypothetical protein